MRHRRATPAAAAVIGGLAMVLLATAPGSAQLSQPAELPPPGFEGTEYVDSAGCVFGRVDVAGRVEWVPRVGPDRQQLCGLEPTVSVAAAPQVAPEPVLEASAPVPVTPAAAPPSPRTAVRTSAVVPAPPPVHVAPVALIPVQILLPDTEHPSRVRLRAPCPDPSSIAAQYLENGIVPGCTTAPAPPRDVVYGTDHPRPRGTVSPVARLRVERPAPPPGYRTVWTDGRLNPYRGIRTVEGEAQMRMVWSDTVPRRLVPAD